MTTSWRLRRRSTAARRAPHQEVPSRAESPYALSSAPSTAASSTTCTARPSAARAARSSSRAGSCRCTAVAKHHERHLPGKAAVLQARRVNFRVASSSGKQIEPLACILLYLHRPSCCYGNRALKPTRTRSCLCKGVRLRMASLSISNVVGLGECDLLMANDCVHQFDEVLNGVNINSAINAKK